MLTGSPAVAFDDSGSPSGGVLHSRRAFPFPRDRHGRLSSCLSTLVVPRWMILHIAPVRACVGLCLPCQPLVLHSSDRGVILRHDPALNLAYRGTDETAGNAVSLSSAIRREMDTALESVDVLISVRFSKLGALECHRRTKRCFSSWKLAF
ncbi:hypothetical protein HN011_003935 [Eciton burchellii]|nr:hypothetical protein HN011_003935 [Eciton burchellii]